MESHNCWCKDQDEERYEATLAAICDEEDPMESCERISMGRLVSGYLNNSKDYDAVDAQVVSGDIPWFD